MRTTIHVATRDRPHAVALLLQSLRAQTYQDWDLVILDDASQQPITTDHNVSQLLTRIRLENHCVKQLRTENSKGVCHARNFLIEHDDFENPLTCRLDDDVVLEPAYLQNLYETIQEGYDLASGVVPILGTPEHVRQTKRVQPVINEHLFDENGQLVVMKDECGFCYDADAIIQTHQFRTNALYKSDVHEFFEYPKNLTKTGFREEGFFSLTLQIHDRELAVRTGAVAYHLQTPTGGCRSDIYQENVQLDDETFREWAQKMYEEHGNFLSEVSR